MSNVLRLVALCGGLTIAALDVGEVRTAQTEIAHEPPTRASQPSWSPDGMRIAFRGGGYPDTEVWTARIDGSAPRRITENDVPDEYPKWSPDGHRIAFSSRRGGSWKLFVMDADDSVPRPLLTTSRHEHDPSEPSWSPDGRLIAVRVTTGEGEGSIHLVRADGSGSREVTGALGLDDEPKWSADGQSIVFSSTRDGNREIYRMNADGSDQQRLTDNPAIDGHPSWFPDGRRIAFVTNRDGRMNWEVYTMNSDGSGQTNRTRNSYWDAYPTVSPDGTSIAFVSIRTGGMSGPAHIYTIAPDGSREEQVFPQSIR